MPVSANINTLCCCCCSISFIELSELFIRVDSRRHQHNLQFFTVNSPPTILSLTHAIQSGVVMFLGWKFFFFFHRSPIRASSHTTHDSPSYQRLLCVIYGTKKKKFLCLKSKLCRSEILSRMKISLLLVIYCDSKRSYVLLFWLLPLHKWNFFSCLKLWCCLSSCREYE